jgi:predicted AAA+ superfamily ATPase
VIPRKLASKVKAYLRSFPVVVVSGPRQSGKTTLLQNLFPQRRYVSLEDPDIRLFAQHDPRGFLTTYPPPVIFDEAQKAPELFSYLQTKVDELKKEGLYLLSGSQNLTLAAKVSQSLSGRAGLLTLPPLSFAELERAGLLIKNVNRLIFAGFYPRPWAKKIKPGDWYANYVQTYLERDVRQIKNISDLSSFQRFLKLCAGRTGQSLNFSSFAADVGISHNTVRSWLSVLEASYLVFFLPPYYRNFNKRLVKSPKFYFYDTGLASYLLDINKPDQLDSHPLKGALFETLIISELAKAFLNTGRPINLYYLKDKSGFEVDCLFPLANRVRAVEIKSGETANDSYFQNLLYWQNKGAFLSRDSFVIYTGKEKQQWGMGTLLNWLEIAQVIPGK